jgi:hypothetical protein
MEVSCDRLFDARWGFEARHSVQVGCDKSILPSMAAHVRQLAYSLIPITLLAFTGNLHPQSAVVPDKPAPELRLVNLSNPEYPAIAGSALVSGDVELRLLVGPDGAVKSADAISGPLMLRQYSVASAQQLRFECQGCSEAVPYEITFKYRITDPGPEKSCAAKGLIPDPAAELDLSGHQVTISTWERWNCDPVVVRVMVRFRSAKCLYLWKCGLRETGD